MGSVNCGFRVELLHNEPVTARRRLIKLTPHCTTLLHALSKHILAIAIAIVREERLPHRSHAKREIDAMPWLTGCCPMLAAAAVASTGTEPLGAVVVLVGSPEVHAFALLWLIIAAS